MTNTVEIITIGDEILIGQTIDSNAAWLGEKLTALGMLVRRVTTISDQPEDITLALDEAMNRADLTILTGGLGPTKDDKTKQTLANNFTMTLVEDSTVLAHIAELFGSRSISMNELNRKQALLPEGCIPLRNSHGTAPGMWFNRAGKVVVSLPGVPYEMKAICENDLFERLANTFALGGSKYRMIMTTGLPESILAKRIEPWENQLPAEFSLAYLPSPGQVKLRLTATAWLENEMVDQLEEQIRKLYQYIPEAIYSVHNQSLAEVVGDLLRKREASLGTVESCTGGKIAELITAIPGASEYYRGSLLAYSNQVKRDIVGVSQQLLLDHGAVSEPVVRQMAEEGRRYFNTDYCVASSGIAGPGGGTADKPVGLVYLAVSSKRATQVERYKFGNHRGRNIIRSSMAGLNLLRRMLLIESQEN